MRASWFVTKDSPQYKPLEHGRTVLESDAPEWLYDAVRDPDTFTDNWERVQAALDGDDRAPAAIAVALYIKKGTEEALNSQREGTDDEPLIDTSRFEPERVIPLLTDEDPIVREAAVTILGSIGKFQYLHPEIAGEILTASDRIAERLADTDPRVAATAVGTASSVAHAARKRDDTDHRPITQLFDEQLLALARDPPGDTEMRDTIHRTIVAEVATTLQDDFSSPFPRTIAALPQLARQSNDTEVQRRIGRLGIVLLSDPDRAFDHEAFGRTMGKALLRDFPPVQEIPEKLEQIYEVPRYQQQGATVQ